jgi:tetratricopeptide (TPR) repeat protein
VLRRVRCALPHCSLQQAVRIQPQDLWPNFYQGVCASRLGRHEEAVIADSVCIGAAPKAANCFYNRALALGSLGRLDQALRDYDTALRLDSAMANAALNRGVLHYRAKRYDAAMADLCRASELGANPEVVRFNRSLVNRARGAKAVSGP